MNKQLIGRIDKADFPELDLDNIAIKIDTGAYTSSIHCENIIEHEDTIECKFLSGAQTEYNQKNLIFDRYKSVEVKSSNGISQERYVIKSSIRLFGKVYPISLSLNDRSDMKFPVLVGRKFLSGKFIVDPHLENLSFNEKKLLL